MAKQHKTPFIYTISLSNMAPGLSMPESEIKYP